MITAFHAVIAVDHNDSLNQEEILKAIETSIPGTTVIKAVRGGKAAFAIIDDVTDMEVAS